MSSKNIKTTDFTLAEAVSCIAWYMIKSDGKADDTEIKVISEDPFFAQFNVMSNQQIFSDLLASEKLTEIMSKEMPKSFAGCDVQFKEDLINAMVKIILADGIIEEAEETTLNFAAKIVGLTGADLLRITRKENERMQARFKKKIKY
jgi:uncharacterized tellurite resistance protein B-like protein|tara:strand:+ start:87 stop:527 length:441 start_codon:yes stop_codon:yes gene_type:complete